MPEPESGATPAARRTGLRYRRTDLFDRRRRLMADWAAYVA